MKKILIITLMCVLMVVGCNKTENINTLPTGEKGKVVNVVETKATLPKFTVGTMGLYDGGFNNESIKDAKVYEIEAVVNDGYSETTHKYKGFKMNELLKLLEIESYSQITFSSNGGLDVTFMNNEVNDNMFLFFERDGIYLEKSPINLLVPTEPARYSIQNVKTITIS